MENNKIFRTFHAGAIQIERESTKYSKFEPTDLLFNIMWHMGINFKIETEKMQCVNALRMVTSSLCVGGMIYSLAIRVVEFIFNEKGPMGVTEILSILTGNALWISVNMKKHKIMNINRDIILYNNANFGSKFRKTLIDAVCLLTFALPTFASATVMIMAKVTQDAVDKHLTFLTFGVPVELGLYYKYILLFVLRSYDIINFFVYPQITCFLFSVISHNVCCCIEEIRDQIVSHTYDVRAARKAFRSYKKIRDMVSDLENTLSLPLFFAMVFLLSDLFALMTNIVPMVRLHTSLRSLVIVLWALSTSSFHAILLIFRISKIEESYREMIRAFVEFPDDLRSPNRREFLQLLKISAFRDELHLTAWGMFPIRRGFILTVAGTLTTYGVLLIQFT